MKLNHLLFWVGLTVLSVPGFSQAPLNLNATATISTTLSFSGTTTINFGTIAPTAPDQQGSVTVPAVGAVTTVNATANGASPASITLSGTNGAAFSLTVPGPAYTLQLSDGNSHNVTISGITTSLSGTPPAGQLSNLTGNATFTVGATLAFTGSQASGTYHNGTIPISVNYN